MNAAAHQKRGGSCGCGGGDENRNAEDGNAVTGGGFGEQAYNGAAAFGRVYAAVGALVGVVIACILVLAGVFKLRAPHTRIVTATVTRVDDCTPAVRNNSTAYTCTVAAVYAVGGQNYAVGGLSVSRSVPVVTGSALTLRYDPRNPQNAVHEPSPRKLGWGLIGAGALFGGITVGVAVLAYRSKGFAAGYGAIEGLGMLGRAFR